MPALRQESGAAPSPRHALGARARTIAAAVPGRRGHHGHALLQAVRLLPPSARGGVGRGYLGYRGSTAQSTLAVRVGRRGVIRSSRCRHWLDGPSCPDCVKYGFAHATAQASTRSTPLMRPSSRSSVSSCLRSWASSTSTGARARASRRVLPTVAVTSSPRMSAWTSTDRSAPYVSQNHPGDPGLCCARLTDSNRTLPPREVVSAPHSDRQDSSRVSGVERTWCGRGHAC